ncbi:acetate--CoA ligase [bacterium]|nr:acetate--CoA ligase [bacterium]
MIHPPQHGDRVSPDYRHPDPHVFGFDQYKEMYDRSINNPNEFWAEQAEKLAWFHKWDHVMQGGFDSGDISWFTGGKLNVSYNCIDRHLPKKANDIALIWEKDEPGEVEHITYQQLHDDVCRIANVLKSKGVRKGDRVIIYLPMMPMLIYTMLACSRIGAIHSVVFAGFSANSLRDRILDCHPEVLITSDEGCRGGRTIPLKDIVDEALTDQHIVKTVLVARRTNKQVNMESGRDFWLEELMQRERATCPCEWVDAEDPLFILYTSGSTGKPKGLLHTTGGYLVFAAFTHKMIFDYHEGDVYACVADIGWVTGHSYIVYGPLANGATSVVFESTPLYPDAGRYWDMIQRHKINQFYTAPTAIRAIQREGDEFPKKYDRSSLRVLGTVGEPINPEAWMWYHDVVGEKKCPIVDTWWQTETGGILITSLPGVTVMKPGSATLPFFGVKPVLVTAEGERLEGNDQRGHLCIEMSWPGIARTVYGDHSRFIQTYFTTHKGLYFTGDACRRDEDGYYWIIGRVDDVINVAGHRLGTAEIESSIAAHDFAAEAAVVGVPHDLKGTAIFAFVVPSKEAEEMDKKELFKVLRNHVREDISPIAAPEQILFARGLPKTRSGKVMRRILRKIANGEYSDLGNTTTLADPTIVDNLISAHKDISEGVK